MEGNVENNGLQRIGPWRIAAWAAAVVFLLAIAVAAQFTGEVRWSAGDFVLAGVLLFGSLGAYELVARMTSNSAYRAGFGVAIAAVLLLIWINGAVGIIGSENNDANLMYGGVVAVAVIGTLVARFRPRGMARTMFATAFAQALVAVIALIGGLGAPASGPAEIVLLNGFFVALFAGSARLFQEVAREQPRAGGEPEG